VSNLPNIKSAIKRVKVTKTKTLRNKVKKSALKTSIKLCKESISKSDSSTNNDILKKTMKTLDKAAAKNLLHKNTVARKKSKLVKAFNAASAVK
jgi:small subunit ribosomal protein S20